jgi:hypothetical protein
MGASGREEAGTEEVEQVVVPMGAAGGAAAGLAARLAGTVVR